MFRFHTGSIKSVAALQRHNIAACFDSILVRLKASVRVAITTVHVCHCFDSILVRLKVYPLGAIKGKQRCQCFDSILVRLKVYGDFEEFERGLQFRFHTGSM